MIWGYPYFRKHPYVHMSYGRNYLFGENAITKCGDSPIGFAALEYGLWGIGFRGPPMGYEGSLHRFKVQGNFFLLCSSTNFVGYSYCISWHQSCWWMAIYYIYIHINTYISNRFTHLKYCYAVTMWSYHVLSTHLKTWSCLPSPKHHLNCHPFKAFLSCSRSSLFSSSLRQWIRWIPGIPLQSQTLPMKGSLGRPCNFGKCQVVCQLWLHGTGESKGGHCFKKNEY